MKIRANSHCTDWPATYVGIPFQEFGRDRDGCDCWGLCRLIWREQFGIDVPSYAAAYGSAFDRERLSHLIPGQLCNATAWQSVHLGEEQTGDMLLLNMIGRPVHVGLVVRPGQMIHVQRGHNAVLEDYHRSAWRRRIRGVYRPVA